MEELWKQAVAYKKGIKILLNIECSTYGRFRNKNNIYLNGSINPDGYLASTTSINNIKIPFIYHQVIAYTFLNHKPSGLNLIVDHINNNPLDNRLENLQLISNKENLIKDKKYLGTYFTLDKYKTQIKINGIQRHIGLFLTQEEALKAYNIAKENINSFENNKQFRNLIKGKLK